MGQKKDKLYDFPLAWIKRSNTAYYTFLESIFCACLATGTLQIYFEWSVLLVGKRGEEGQSTFLNEEDAKKDCAGFGDSADKSQRPSSEWNKLSKKKNPEEGRKKEEEFLPL